MILQVINVYKCNDGRYRAYCRDENGQPKIVSYPRILMEQSLGRPLELFEDIHHINGDASDNVLDNLTIRQSAYFRDIKRKKNRIIACSKSCSSYYSRLEQLGRNPKAECGLNGEPLPNGNAVPNSIIS